MLHMFGGLDNPTSGKVIVDGQDLSHMTDEELTIFRRRNIGFVFQQYNLVPMLNVWENIILPVKLDGKKIEKKYVDEIIDTLGIRTKLENLPSALSGGQQQRVALARMMIGEPEAILLDEPFSALDGYLKDVLQREMQDFLKDYPGDMILVTHSRDEAYKFCRELSIVHEGRILVTGETKQLFERPGLLEAAKLTGCKNFSRAERLGPHEIYAADWKMKLHTEENVDMDITHVGIRGHWIRPESEPGENCMAVQVDQYIETTFEHQYMIRNKAEENAAGLWWMRPKNSFTEDPDKDLPEYLYFPPEHLMLLK